MSYKHGVSTTRSTSMPVSAGKALFGIQVVVGTAPINMLDDPASAVNKPIVVTSWGDFIKKFGYSEDFDKYTLTQAAYASFKLYSVAPVVMINVIDPATHVEAVTEKELTVTKGTAVTEDEGILLSTLKVTYDEGTSATNITDYVASFDDNGHVVIAVTPGGALKDKGTIKLAYSKLDTTHVDESTIVGGLQADGTRKGIEVVDEVYSTLGIVPGVLSAPGYSSKPKVASALEMKAELCCDFLNAFAVVDVECETVKKCDDVAAAKDKLGVFSRWVAACWPKVSAKGKILCMSAVVSALLQNISIENGNIPCESPDNLSINIDGLVLNDGKEVKMILSQVNNQLNAEGIISCIYMGGWKCWGNNTVAYPDDTKPNDRFVKCVMMANYLEDRFKTAYLPKIGRNASPKAIDAIITEVNAEYNALVPGYLAGAEIVFEKDDNPIEEMLAGHLKFRVRYADYTPIEYIENEFTWDASILESVFTTEGDE